MVCPGKNPDEEMCGGRFAISVYEMEGTPRDIPDDAKYLGCFADRSEDRALTLSSTSNDTDMSYGVRSTVVVVIRRGTYFYKPFEAHFLGFSWKLTTHY